MTEAVRNAPFTIQIAHDQLDTTSYRLLINGTQEAEIPVDPAGVQFPFASGLVPGSYTFQVIAVGPAGETASDPVELLVVPGVPAKPRVVIVIG